MIELSTKQAFDAAVQFHHSGRLADAEALYRQVIDREPKNDEAIHLLALLTSEAGRHEDGLELIDRAIAINPASAEYRTNRGVILAALGRTSDAIADYSQALSLQPNLVDARINLAHALSAQARWNEAAASLRVALVARPENPTLHNDLGIALYNLGQFDGAIIQFEQALRLQPNYAEAHNNLGNALYLRGKFDEAIAEYRKAVELAPSLVDAKLNLANALDARGLPNEGLKFHLAAVRARPDDPAAHCSLGDALLAKPDLDTAAAAYQQAIALRPDCAQAHNALGIVLREQGRLDQAIQSIQKAVALCPDDAAFNSNLVSLMSLHHAYTPAALATEQRRWNRIHADPLKNSIVPHHNDPSADRKLRVGYISPDFKHHVVGRCILPLLSEHDPQLFEIYCYSTTAREDALTDLLRPHATAWRNVAPLTDAELAQLIRDDRIDILVDLSLHTAGNRLVVFARKPAPVQVTYLGYCASTGLQAIDYRLSDPHLDPPETDLSLYSEQTIRLPETYWCYQLAGPAPPPSAPPSEAAGFITFGCLNNFAKVSPPAMDLWAQILQAVPNSRLILHAHPGSHVESTRKRFVAAGISPERLEFLAKQPWPQYVQTYGRIDIALDPFPWCGGITTCDALWMGVPVVTLSGQTAVGRGGRSILTNIGLPELIARRPRQYVQTAISLSQSPQRLAELRQTLRQRMLASPLMNARRFARNVETAYRQMWRRWCLTQSKV